MKKIGVLRAGALGDFILTLPALEALKSSFPGAELVLLGRKAHREFFEGRPGPVDRFVALPPFVQFNETILRPSGELESFMATLVNEEFDLLVQLHGGGRFSNYFLKKLKARKTIGARTENAPELDVNVPYTQFQHEILRQLEIVKKAGAKVATYSPKVELREGEQEEARARLFELTGRKEGFILLNPGATDPRRRWPARNFASISEKYFLSGFDVLINTGPGEEQLAQEVRSLTGPNVHIVSPSLKELPGLISLCDLVISNDTGTMHLAQALGCPTVALFWFVNLLNYGPTVSDTNRVLVSWQVNCPTCGQRTLENDCGHTDSFISDIPQDQVMKASEELLQRRVYGHESNRS